MNVDRVVIWLMANNANAKTLCFDIKTAENPENSWKHDLYNEVGISILYVNALSDCMKSFTLGAVYVTTFKYTQGYNSSHIEIIFSFFCSRPSSRI